MKIAEMTGTTTGAVAAVNHGLGGGDPSASIYSNGKKKLEGKKLLDWTKVSRPSEKRRKEKRKVARDQIKQNRQVNEDCGCDGNAVSENTEMAQRKLYAITKNSMELFQLLKNTDVVIDPWMIGKLEKAEDYISSINDHVGYESGTEHVYDSELDVDDPTEPELATEPVDPLPDVSTTDFQPVTNEPLDFETDQETLIADDAVPTMDSYVDASEVLRMAQARQIISSEQMHDPEFPLWGIASDVAESIPVDSDMGTSDWSIWLRDFVRKAHYANISLNGKSAHLYENRFRARDILDKMRGNYPEIPK